VSRRLKSALLKKLSSSEFQFLLILMQASASLEKSNDKERSEFPFLVSARNEFREDFTKIDPRRRKWRMFSLKASSDGERQRWCGKYVHSKTMIVDDECAIIGSANADDRGYTFDTEIVASIADDPLGRAAGDRFARDLRVNLWQRHLGVPHAKLENWSDGLRSWLTPPGSAMIVPDSDMENSPLLGSKAVLRNIPQADQEWRETIDPDADALP
jgi:phosphatidylserine/phosphatidylglycerophosphate/cardiolipin synthase-like enzyme